MKKFVLDEIEIVTGDLLTPDMRNELADRVIKVMEERNRMAALTAIETVKEKVMRDSHDAAKAEEK